MNVLYLSYYYLPHVGGGTWATYFISSKLSRKGHDVHIIVPNVKYGLSINEKIVKDFINNDNVKISRTPVFRLPRLLGPIMSPLFIFFKGLKLGCKTDVIVSQYHPHHLVPLAAILLGRILTIPVVIRACDIYTNIDITGSTFKQRVIDLYVKCANTINEFILRHVRFVFVVCSEQREILISRSRGLFSNFVVGLSPNGADLHNFNDILNKTLVKKSLGIGSREKVLLFIGRYSGPEYGIETLLRAIPLISQTLPEVRLILVGDKISSTQWSIINSLNISEKVKAYGPVSRKQVSKFIAAADICIGPLMPTLTIPLKVIEYMAGRKPIITGVNSVSKDVVIDGYNCICVLPEPTALSKTILKVFENRELAEMLASNGSRTAVRFGWDQVANDFEAKLFQVVD